MLKNGKVTAGETEEIVEELDRVEEEVSKYKK